MGRESVVDARPDQIGAARVGLHDDIFRIVDDVDIIPAAADEAVNSEDVIPRPAVEGVVAVTAVESVGSRATVEGVVESVACNGVG